MHADATGSAPHILFVIDTFEVGGAEQSLLQSVNSLVFRGFQCSVCSMYPGETLIEEFRQSGADVFQLNLPGKYSFLKGIRGLSSLIRELSPNLVHTTLFRSDQIGRLAGWIRRVPVVSSFCSVPYDQARIETDPSVIVWKLKCLQLLDVTTARLPVRFHAVSSTAKAVNCRDLRVREDRVTVIPRGRNVSNYQLRDRPMRRSDQQISMLMVGRLIPAKGHADVLEAMRYLITSKPNVHLLIAGDGPLQNSIHERVEALELADHVSILGYRNDISELLQQADLFVFASLYEGLPGALIEAMLAALPIVATGIPQVKELIQHNHSGLLVPPRDPKALANAIQSVIEDHDLARAIGTAAYATARDKFDIDVVTQQMEDFYRGVLSESHQHPE